MAMPCRRPHMTCAVFAGILLTAPFVRANTLEVLDAHEEYVYMVSFSRDSRLMVTAAGDNTAIIWNVETRKPIHVLQHDAAVYAVGVSPDGRMIATGCGEGHVAIWKTR